MTKDLIMHNSYPYKEIAAILTSDSPRQNKYKRTAIELSKVRTTAFNNIMLALSDKIFKMMCFSLEVNLAQSYNHNDFVYFSLNRKEMDLKTHKPLNGHEISRRLSNCISRTTSAYNYNITELLSNILMEFNPNYNKCNFLIQELHSTFSESEFKDLMILLTLQVYSKIADTRLKASFTTFSKRLEKAIKIITTDGIPQENRSEVLSKCVKINVNATNNSVVRYISFNVLLQNGFKYEEII